jgi:hypothetical protein
MARTNGKSADLTHGDLILIRLLAMRDAYFVPVRRFLGSNLNPNAWSMRKRYLADGVPWASGNSTEQSRKESQRALEQLAKAGMVKRSGAGGRTVGVTLTDKGEWRACSLAFQFTLADGVGLYRAIERRAKASGIAGIDIWEDDLLPSLPQWAKDLKMRRESALAMMQDLYLPWMVRGFVAACPTLQANCRYMIAAPLGDAGLGDETDPDLYREDARAIYIETLDGERDRLAEADLIDRGEIGPIPATQSAATEEQVKGWELSAAMAKRGE